MGEEVGRTAYGRIEQAVTSDPGDRKSTANNYYSTFHFALGRID